MVTVLGGWQSDFARNWARDGMEIGDGFAQALGEGLAATGLEPGDIQTGHVGNFVADLFALYRDDLGIYQNVTLVLAAFDRDIHHKHPL